MSEYISTKDTEPLLLEVEALCRVYLGKNAESEPWGETCERFERLNKLAKKLRTAIAKATD